jgi:hypothetical protein
MIPLNLESAIHTMISIKDIYQWDNLEEPRPAWDLHLTPLQALEWREQNSKAIADYEDYKAKSFVGELLVASPAIIDSIQSNKIMATAMYRGDLNRTGDPLYYRLGNVLEVTYDVLYDKALYKTVRLIHNNSKVELEGEIIGFNTNTHFFDEGSWRCFKIHLKLSGIKITANRYVCYEGFSNQSLPAGDLLDDTFRLKPKPNPSSNCFIATAAFGHQEVIEVTQFRELRDNVLVNSLGGRLMVTMYGLLSPPIAYLIKQSSWLRKLVRTLLRNVVLPLTQRRTNQFLNSRGH